jgi:hypothetical protein
MSWPPKIIRELFLYDGATNDNLEEVLKQIQRMLRNKNILGSSTEICWWIMKSL